MNIVIIAFAKGGALMDYLSSLSSSLARDNNVTVMLPYYADIEKLPEGVRIARLPFPSNLLGAMLQTFNPFSFRLLTREVNRVSPDVLHIAFEPRFPFSFAWLLHRKYPVVTTIHEPKPLATEVIRTFLLNGIQVINNKLLIKFSDKVIVHGEHHRRYLLAQKVPSHKVEVVPHGDFSLYAHYQTSNITEAEGGNILFFGRIVSYKGLDYLIEAGKLVRKHIPHVTITIAGEGKFTKYEKLISEDEGFVIWNRFIPDEEVTELFGKASLVVLPYIAGTQSGIITIAAAFKKPVVATNVGNFSEMVENGKTGFIVPPKDSNALAEAIIKLLKDDKLRQEMGENAYKMVREKFSWDDIAQKTLEVYKEAIEARKQGTEEKGKT